MDIFVLITGYFMINSEFSIKKVIKLITQVQFYTVGFGILFILVGMEKLSIMGVIRKIFPTMFYQYCFFTAYIVLYIFSPYINRLLQYLSAREHLKLISIMLIMWSVMPTFKISNMYGSEVLQFFMLYCIGAYIRCHLNYSRYKAKTLGKVLISSCGVMMILSVVLCNVLGARYEVFARNATQFFGQESIFAIGLAVGLLLLFTHIEIGINRNVNIISSCTFGVYLIQNNSQFHDILYNSFLQSYKYQNSKWLLAHMFICVVLIFMICTVIEFIRKQTVERMIMVVIDKYYNRTICFMKNRIKIAMGIAGSIVFGKVR